MATTVRDRLAGASQSECAGKEIANQGAKPDKDMTEKILPFLPMVRRLEAAGFRAWPARHVAYDGSWQIRLTPGHPSKRLNCVVPLDPGDSRDIETRIEKCAAMFEASGRPLDFRQSPLCPPQLASHFSSNGWTCLDETVVMAADLDSVNYGDGMDHLPTHDVNRFAEACLKIDTDRDTSLPVLVDILSSVKPATGLFLIEDAASGPVAVTLCVADNDLAGISQVVVAEGKRRQGIGREIVASALRWAKLRGARKAWLQVRAGNRNAIALYESMGFGESYRQNYWRRPR
jgi:GNAT superfamily N-acetyltransferase